MINDVTDIRERNIKEIINAVRFDDGLTKKDISGKTALSFSTVSNLTNELIENNVLYDSKQVNAGVGRNPVNILLGFSNYCSICIDLQIENALRYAILDLRNNILCKEIVDITGVATTLEIAQIAKEKVQACILKNDLGDKEVIGVGISVPAVFDKINERLVNSSVRVYESSPLKEDFQNAFGMPIYVDNIANFYALSIHSTIPDVKNVLCMDISQGVGIGVVAENHLIRGKNGYGTEVAHIPIGDPSKKCQFCGGYGCVETDLSMYGILSNYCPDEYEGTLLNRWKRFVSYLHDDEEMASSIARDVGKLSGQLASILVNIFDPELFFVGGYIMDLPISIEPYFMDEVNLRCNQSISRGLEIQFDQNDAERIMVGISNTIYDGWNPINKSINRRNDELKY